ncbi:MAG TPA: hypothetical protein VM118_10505 [Acidobacteriota bacterium]|nr:hypothetical protein [Acidobacteriota bacterium]
MSGRRQKKNSLTEQTRRSLLIVFGLAVALLIVQSVYFWDFGIDDVGISYRYALHLAEGKGLTWNTGGPKVEGYSNFLWVVILAGGKLLGFDIEITSKILGVVLAAVSLLLFTILCRRIWYPQPFWWAPVLLVTVTPEWTAWSLSGLEISLYGAFLLLAALGLTSVGRERTTLLAAGVAGLTLTRPEGVAVGFALLFAGVLFDRDTALTVRIRAVAIPAIVGGATFLALVLFRYAYFGYPLPNTVYAKFAGTLPSLGRVVEWLIFGLPFLLAWVIALRRLPHRGHLAVLATAPALVLFQALIVLPVHPVMYFLHRYQIAFLPLLVLSVPAALALIARRKRWAGIAVGVLVLAWTLQGWPAVHARYDSDKYVMDRQRCIVDHLSVLRGTPVIAMVDAGRIPYWTDLPSIDAWGLCEVKTARRGFSAEETIARRPTAYIMSVNIRRRDEIRAHLGMDIIMTKIPEFNEEYALWKVCTGGAAKTEEHYDYAILLNVAWAQEQGLGERITRINWNY